MKEEKNTRTKATTNRSQQQPLTEPGRYFVGATGSPNLGWRAPAPAEPAALPVAVGGVVVVEPDGADAAGRFGSGAGLSSPWQPVTTNTETLTTTSAMSWRKKDEKRMCSSYRWKGKRVGS